MSAFSKRNLAEKGSLMSFVIHAEVYKSRTLQLSFDRRQRFCTAHVGASNLEVVILEVQRKCLHVTLWAKLLITTETMTMIMV